MKIDHIVMNIDKKYQKDQSIIKELCEAGLPYEPKWGKGTRGFKASNLWVGNEYFEMIHIKKANGGGWKKEWVNWYHKGHRGMICLMLDVNDIDLLYRTIAKKGIEITKPEWLEFSWFCGLLTRKMPWRNCYLPFFEGVHLQIGFQQMKDQKAREFMEAYMVPNARDHGISGIESIQINGPFTDKDFQMLSNVFETKATLDQASITIQLMAQNIIFVKAAHESVCVYTNREQDKTITIENVQLHI